MRSWLALGALIALSGCFFTLYPGPGGDYDPAFASSFYSGQRPGAPVTGAEQLTVEQLYSVHRFGLNRMHPARSMNGEFARRGAAAVPYLRAKLEAQQSWGQVASILEIFRAMQDAGSFDARDDPALVAVIQRTAHAYPVRPYSALRDMADEIETGARFPNRWPPWGRRPFQGLGRDYDRDFARAYCRECDYLDWVAGLDSLGIEQLYAVHRFGWEGRAFPRDVDAYVAQRGAATIPFLKQRLTEGGTGFMIWNIFSVLQRMQHEGHYDVLGDAELMRLAAGAAAGVEGGWSGYVRQNLEDLRKGQLSVW